MSRVSAISRRVILYAIARVAEFRPTTMLVIVVVVAAVGWLVMRPSRGGTGGRKTAANGATLAAAAPPIAANAKLTHPEWGACQKCHKILGGKPKATPPATTPAAFAGADQSWLGARLQDLTDQVSNQLDMEVKKGALVMDVTAGSITANAGLKADDVILRLNNQVIADVANLRGSLATLAPGSKVKLQIARGESNKNVFLRLPGTPATPAEAGAGADATALSPSPLSAQPAAFPVAGPGRVAIAVMAPNEDAQVAPAFGDAPHFLVRDTQADQWLTTPNPYAGRATRGQAVVQMLAQYGVAAVIAGNIGPGTFRSLQNAGMQVYSGAFGTAKTVYQQYRLNQLVASTSTIVPAAATPGPSGTVAVAAMGTTLDSPVCPNLTSSPYFVFFNLATRTKFAMANPSPGDQSPGNLLIVQFLASRGATAVVAGNTNAQTVGTLSRYGIMGFFGVEGKVDDAVNMYAAGTLRAATIPNVAIVGGAPLGAQ
jgi:predicted Fe-Mo cluster-binding NifX family protein